jgi:hypothetical protein
MGDDASSARRKRDEWRQGGEVEKEGPWEGRTAFGVRELPAHHVGGRNNRSGGGNKDKRGHNWGRTQKIS